MDPADSNSNGFSGLLLTRLFKLEARVRAFWVATESGGERKRGQLRVRFDTRKSSETKRTLSSSGKTRSILDDGVVSDGEDVGEGLSLLVEKVKGRIGVEPGSKERGMEDQLERKLRRGETKIHRTHDRDRGSLETPTIESIRGLGWRPVDQTRRPKGTAKGKRKGEEGQLRSRLRDFSFESKYSRFPSPSISIHPSPTLRTRELGWMETPSRANCFMA